MGGLKFSALWRGGGGGGGGLETKRLKFAKVRLLSAS